jgi:fermentation-respiration switch protein FrsA (DUF1100 family)
MEYPGYSVYQSKEISEEKIILDAERVMEHLVETCKVPLEQIIIMGRSLGSGPACYVSTKYSVRGLILVSPFTSIKELAGEHYGLFGRLLIKDRFNNLSNIKKAQCPVLIIHGDSDELVPLSHAEALQSRSILL